MKVKCKRNVTFVVNFMTARCQEGSKSPNKMKKSHLHFHFNKTDESL